MVVTATIIMVLYADHRGFNYFRGKEVVLPEKFLQWSHMLVWAGLIVTITTGALLLIPAWEYRLTQPAFYVKMWLVSVLLMNAFAIGKLAKLSATVPYAQLSKSQQITLMVSGALSFVGWVGAFTIGKFIL